MTAPRSPAWTLLAGGQLPIARGGFQSLAGCAVLLVLAPAVLSEYQVYALAVTFGYAIAALGVGIAFSSLGVLALGQAGFMAIGAFFSLYLLQSIKLPFGLVLVLCLLLGLLCGVLYGWLASQLAVFPLAVVGFAFAFLMMDLGSGNVLKRFTGGETGLSVPAGTVFGADVSQGLPMYWLSAFVLLLCLLATLLLLRSSVGRALLTIKRDETLAASCGIPVGGYKVALLALCTGFGSLGGALVAQSTNFASPLQFGPALTISLLAMALVGGVRFLLGPLVGTLMLDTLPFLIKMRADDRQVLIGAVLLLVLVLAPHGLLEWVHDRFVAFRSRRRGTLQGPQVPQVPHEERPQ